MKRGWVFWLLVAVVVVLIMWMRADRAKPPDERIADHVRTLCKIAERGKDAPVDGVRRYMRFYGDHGPTIARDWADLLVLIERIDDDAAHDARAHKARRVMREPMVKCARTFEQFARAVERDREASALLERGFTRLSRTLEILFGDRSHALTRAPFLPLEHLLPTEAP